MKKWSKREKGIGVLTISLVIFYGAIYFVFKPVKNKIEIIDTQIMSQKRKLNASMKIIRQAQGLGDEYGALIDKFKQEGGNDQVVSKIFAEVQSVARQLNLQISDLKPKRVQEEAFYNRFMVSLTINSDFPKIVQFIYTLQNKPHLFGIEEVRIEQGSRRNTSTVLTQLTLSKILIP